MLKGFAGLSFDDDKCLRGKPVAGFKCGETRLDQPFFVGRVHEGEGEWLTDACRLGSEIGGTAPMDARVSEELEAFDIIADRAAGRAFGFNEEAEGCAP